ncbi:Rab family GTPase [Paraglaciecola aquimarina]|uniref:Rab family GTPase n=1 Tax=Paraglaciecola aquimarina TaxID=1235557 RepID=A0ABU3SUD2_9ALTE|nr:Rab family GTPase [Paraglaciecola aquimarina]MDU0353626.1 Rab family GTPase [Paraglaciecola aquimarina]
MIQKKICILGASGVGKTSLIKQFVDGIFSEKYLTTIGVKIDKKVVETKADTVQLMIWDIEGIDRYCGFKPKYLRGASAFIIAVDRTRSQSLVEGTEIFRQVKETTDIPGVIAINKKDLESSWHWTENELKEFQHPFVESFDTSAKTGEGVEEMFSYIANILME